MNGRSAIRATVAALALLAVVGTAAHAEFASGIQATGPYDGIKGNQGIRTDPMHRASIAFAHPVQADVGAPDGDFVATGTY